MRSDKINDNTVMATLPQFRTKELARMASRK